MIVPCWQLSHLAHDELVDAHVTTGGDLIAIGGMGRVDPQRADGIGASVDFDYRVVNIDVQFELICYTGVQGGTVAIMAGVLIDATLRHVTE
jgi:hypothetical protein